MSYLYTNENAIRSKKQNNLIDIINPLVIWNDSIEYYAHVVSLEEEMRPDLICYNIYGNFEYIDEFLTWNNILNPWSIKQGQIVKYVNESDISILKLQATEDSSEVTKSLVNPSKDNKKDPNREQGTGLIPTIKPSGVKEVEVDFNNKKIKIMDSFK
jgi:hypothetical protein